jgi:D-beta-D-heptose 7-phosphate kinase/D-beta-D-heptose 1-phosphate adenosyltransferase
MLNIPDFSKTKIFVMGDVMLDRYLFGLTDRVSPEAPVPVVRITETDDRPGGAANVAINLSKVGIQTSLFGVVGQDAEGALLENLLISENIECNLIKIENLNTTIKTRIQSRGQQLIRFDRDSSLERGRSFKEEVEKNLLDIDAIIISDYAKGVTSDIAEIINICNANDVLTLVDPKGLDFKKYTGVDILTPNQNEFEAVAGACDSDNRLVEKALEMIRDLKLKALLITRSNKGMLLVRSNGEHHFLDTEARDVFDVTGAGDTVIAIFAAAIASGADILSAAKIANLAAGVVVGKIGVAYIDQMELQSQISKSSKDNQGIQSLSQLQDLVNFSRRNSEKVVMTNGCFDILHAGHIAYLEEAKNLGDKLIVAVNDDNSVKQLKGSMRPINSLNDRMMVISGLACVDWVISFSEETPLSLIKNIKPDVLVKGGDYSIDGVVGGEEVIQNGGEVKVLSFKKGFSTSAIIKKLQT